MMNSWINIWMNDAQLLPLIGLQTCQGNQNNMNKLQDDKE